MLAYTDSIILSEGGPGALSAVPPTSGLQTRTRRNKQQEQRPAQNESDWLALRARRKALHAALAENHTLDRRGVSATRESYAGTHFRFPACSEHLSAQGSKRLDRGQRRRLVARGLDGLKPAGESVLRTIGSGGGAGGGGGLADPTKGVFFFDTTPRYMLNEFPKLLLMRAALPPATRLVVLIRDPVQVRRAWVRRARVRVGGRSEISKWWCCSERECSGVSGSALTCVGVLWSDLECSGVSGVALE